MKSGSNGKSTPRQYRRSTPVGRLRRNAAKVARHASLVQARIASWGDVEDERVAQVRSRMEGILVLASEADRIMERLEVSGFVPPKKSGALVYQIGQHVMISPKARPKYREVFKQALRDDPRLLDDLVVDNLLPTGEVVVRRGKQLPFMTAKSHLLPGDPPGVSHGSH
jgi:hypothetical protein